jgi:tetratricopeptide (TPR) repeat protein
VPEDRKVNDWPYEGQILLEVEDNKKTTGCFGQTLETDVRDEERRATKATASTNCLGRYKDAVPFLYKSLKLDPYHLLAWVNKDNSRSSLGRQAEAFRCCKLALDFDSLYANAWNRSTSA